MVGRSGSGSPFLILNACRRSSYRTPSPTTKDSVRSGRSGESSGPTGPQTRPVYARISRPAATKQRHVGSNPDPETLDPDRWTDEFAFLSRPGEDDIQIDLFYDYRTNVTNYPAWGAWLRLHQPPTLVIWGKYDPSFLVAETAAYQRDLPGAEVHILDAGHFALYEKPQEVAELVGDFLGRTLGRPAELKR